MVRMLTIAHAARCACQATRNQARPWWGTIDKFEATTFYWRVSIPLHYLFEPRLQSDKPKPTKMPGPGCDKCKDKCQDCKCGDNCTCCDTSKGQCDCKTGGKCTCTCSPCTC